MGGVSIDGMDRPAHLQADNAAVPVCQAEVVMPVLTPIRSEDKEPSLMTMTSTAVLDRANNGSVSNEREASIVRAQETSHADARTTSPQGHR